MDDTLVDKVVDGAIAASLALFTWLSLHVIGLLGTRDETNRLMAGRSSEEGGGEGESCSTSSPYDGYVNFLWIFACIYALSKLTQLSERYLGHRLLGQKQSCDVRSINLEWEHTLQMYEEEKRQLDEQVRVLREKNLNLERTMNDLRDCNIHLISENFMRSVLHEQARNEKPPPPPQSNIYITNSHFHLTRQVFVNEGHIDLKVRNSGGEDLCPADAPEEGLNVWMQYLRMRKCYMGPIADPNLITPSSPDHLLPIVMTTEQLAKLQGMI
ncbi:uncharacterized protein Dana_GF11046 [Drosophila ananassae]|uniref:Uncharacterized protein n=1 Tax=Drosophila ananassae TaxID=7217 RepID=B3MJ67_DROAN|nr:uncharacterized protein LOC6493912 [Drosophila ananassae]EDV38161.2 uncharacterized protein Dana_GF11046 [Drosophila ananassae]